MSKLQKEECPICYTEYCNTIVPVSINCGHTVCEKCCELIRHCPICRKKIAKNCERPKNFALLAQMDKIDNNIVKETRDCQVQVGRPTIKPPQAKNPSQLLSHALNGRKGLNFRLNQKPDGTLKGISVTFK
jgi:hypothetical protein